MDAELVDADDELSLAELPEEDVELELAEDVPELDDVPDVDVGENRLSISMRLAF